MPENTQSNAGHRQRLKEKFIKSSLEGFHDYETLELLLTFAIPRRDVKPLAKELLKRFKSLKCVFEATLEELTSVPGVGENTALLLMLLRTAAYSYINEGISVTKVIRSAKDAIDCVSTEEGGESFTALYLNSKNEVLGIEVLHKGPLGAFAVSPKAVIRKAFSHNARSIIFVHRKPGAKALSGNQGKELIQELEAAASAIDIIVHDHIIIGSDRHISGRELGWVKGGG